MARTKLKKFVEIESRASVIEPSKSNYKTIKGNWHQHFGNDNPIIVELACGFGEYTNGLAELHPENNYIGVDVKGDRIWMASTISIEKNLSNTLFLRCEIDHLLEFFALGEISELWIVHPDPFLRDGDKNKRLTSPKFLKIYRQLLKKGSNIHLKTDNKVLFDYTVDILKQENITPHIITENLHKSLYLEQHHGILTRFEQKALDKQGLIYYLKLSM
jgi:tRNA (guanine-N7-)-methyltransferase